MDKVVAIDPIKLIEAVRIWTGWGGISPDRDDLRLTQQLGAKDAIALMPLVKQLHDDFYTTDAGYVAEDMSEMSKLAKEHFKLMYPDLPGEIGEIFAWCYTFDFR